MVGPGDQRSLFPGGEVPGGRLELPDLWLTHLGPEGDVVISSRMRLARNVDGFRFKSRFGDGEGERLVAFLRDVLEVAEPELTYYGMEALTGTEREVMFERHLVSREHVQDDQSRGVAFSRDGMTSVMVNEEDHLRIQVFAPGLDLPGLEERVNAIDERIADRVTYAFDNRFGHRTSCPTNTGTGLRVSVMLHLPALTFRGAGKGQERDIVRMHNAAQQLGLTVRGLYGESSRADGDFFQISNQVTLGRAPNKTVQDVGELVSLVFEWERRNRETHLADNRSQLEDVVWRAWALLTHSRRMASSEALQHLSAVRLGVCLGLLDGVDLATLHGLMVTMRPGHLRYGAERDLEPDERDEVRARLLRDTLSPN